MGTRKDDPRQIAFDWRAPLPERYAAQAELTKSYRPLASSLIPAEDIRPVIEHIRNDLEESSLRKGAQIISLDDRRGGKAKRGMQSVHLDDLQIFATGDFWEKPYPLGFDGLRAMVEQTPVLNAVIMTRIRQVSAFTQPLETDRGTGFSIRHIDKNHTITQPEEESIKLLSRFFLNCGWEFDPRARKRLKRDSLTGFMGKIVRDTLTLDAASVETEMKRDRKLGIDGLYALDGATIRLCAEQGYQGNDEIFAVQVIQGRIRTAYTYDDLIYEVRNPRTDVRLTGYGLGETELLIRVVTGFLNAMTYNISGFDNNSIPKGILHLSGDFDAGDLTAFKRYWNSMVKGVNNAWSLPVMVSKDQESKASFERLGVEFNEMYFSKWMTFLTSIICAVYGMSPDEINFESFSAAKSSLSGSDTAEKLADSRDKGLRPLLNYLQSIMSDFVCSSFSDKYVFRWEGLDPEDEDKRHEIRKAVLSVNEARAQEGYEKSEASWGEAPLNPSLVGAWMQEQQANQPQDFGQPDDEQDNPLDEEPGQDDDRARDGAGDMQAGDEDQQGREGDFGKSFPVIYTVV